MRIEEIRIEEIRAGGTPAVQGRIKEKNVKNSKVYADLDEETNENEPKINENTPKSNENEPKKNKEKTQEEPKTKVEEVLFSKFKPVEKVENLFSLAGIECVKLGDERLYFPEIDLRIERAADGKYKPAPFAVDDLQELKSKYFERYKDDLLQVEPTDADGRHERLPLRSVGATHDLYFQDFVGVDAGSAYFAAENKFKQRVYSMNITEQIFAGELVLSGAEYFKRAKAILNEPDEKIRNRYRFARAGRDVEQFNKDVFRKCEGVKGCHGLSLIQRINKIGFEP